MPRIPRTDALALPHARPRRAALAAFAALLALTTLGLAGCGRDELPTHPDAGAPAIPRAYLTGADTIPWLTKAKMPTARRAFVAASVNGVVYAIGGARDSTTQDENGYDRPIDAPLRTVEAYYPNTTTLVAWRLKAPLPARRARANGASVIAGKIYVSGGRYRKDDADSVAKSLFVYTPSTNTWEQKADMPAPSFGGVQAVIDGKLYVVAANPEGGVDANHLYRYDPAADSWFELAPAPHHHWGGVAGAIDGKLYVAGGFADKQSLAYLDVYYPSQNMWSTKAPLPTPRGGAAGRVAGGKLYVVGGFSGNTLLTRMDAYNPATNSWTRKASLPKARYSAAAAVANGILYLLGGTTGNGIVATNEAYDVP